MTLQRTYKRTWTLGPWYAVSLPHAEAWEVNVAPSWSSHSIVGCMVHNPYIPGDVKANAHLIAAAPDLFDALERLVNAVENVGEETKYLEDQLDDAFAIDGALKEANAAMRRATNVV